MGKAKAMPDISTVLLVIAFLAGLCLLLYPTASNLFNERGQRRVISDYSETLTVLDSKGHKELWDEANAYNEALLGRVDDQQLSDELLTRYENVLDVSGTGIMGYVDIPCIDCTLPIYHGTDDEELQVAAGHIEWTSLPVGGPSTHSVISGHRGLPSAELLTNIDKLEYGDAFYIHVLDKVLEYRVDDVAVVLPDDTERLRVVEGKDYVTLVTCTPYGVNSHRLLVRGVRVGESSVAASNVALMLADEIRPVSLAYSVPTALAIMTALVAAILWAVSKARKAGARRMCASEPPPHGSKGPQRRSATGKDHLTRRREGDPWKN